jgi:hypothetical protein
MKPQARRALMRRVWVAAWGIATVVLLFVIILLSVELAKRAKPAVERQQAAPIPVPAPLIERPGTMPTKAIQAYFPDAQGHGLTTLPLNIAFTDSTVENCRNTLQAIIAGPPDKNVSPMLPPNTKTRGVYMLEDGTLVVDFAIELEIELKKYKSAAFESLMVYGVVNTLCQPELKGEKEAAVTQVSFLIEGMPPRESFPAHVDVSKPIKPNPEWLAAQQ